MNTKKTATPQELRENIEKWMAQKGIRGVMSRTAKYLLPGKKFNFVLNIGGGSYTDGKKVVVGIPEVVHPMKKEVVFSVTKALVGHETEHVWSSDFEVFKEFQMEVREYFRKNHNIRITPKLGAHMLNSTEDGRIEKRVVNRFRGYKKHIQLMNGIFWKEMPCKGENEMMDFLFSFTSMCVTGLKSREWETHYEGTEQDELLDQVRPLMMKAINNPTARGCADDTMEIVEIIAPFMARMLQELKNKQALEELSDKPDFQSSNPQEGGETAPGNSQSSHFLEPDEPQTQSGKNGEESDKKGNGGSGEKDSDNEPETEEEEKEKDGEGEEGEKGQDGEEEEEEKKPELTPEELDDLIEQMLEELEDELEAEVTEAISQGEKEAEAERQKEARENTYLGHLSNEDMKGLDPSARFRQVDPKTVRQHEVPAHVVKTGKMINKELKKLFLNKQSFSSRNRRNGHLDTSALWKLGIKDHNTFLKKGIPTDTSTVVNILVDASGSMTERVDNTGATKLLKATEATAMLEEGLRDLVPTRITYFTSDSGAVMHSTVKDFNQNSKDLLSWKRLPAIRNALNRDGFSIKVGTRELLKRPEQKKILIVLSDGLPSELSQAEGQREVAEAVREARKAGIIVIAIAFGTEYEMESNKTVYKEMYQKGIIMVRPDEIHRYLTKTIETELNR